MTDSQRLARVRAALALHAGAHEHRLAWLSALLSDVARSTWPDAQDDPCAVWQALAECQALLDGLADAFSDELAAQLEAERAASGEGPGPDDELLPY